MPAKHGETNSPVPSNYRIKQNNNKETENVTRNLRSGLQTLKSALYSYSPICHLCCLWTNWLMVFYDWIA